MNVLVMHAVLKSLFYLENCNNDLSNLCYALRIEAVEMLSLLDYKMRAYYILFAFKN